MKAEMVLGFSTLSLLAGVALTASSASAQMVCLNPDPAECQIASGANGEEFFLRDRSIAALGKAWRDESGMIWGDIVRNDDAEHSIRYMVQSSEYMASIGYPFPAGQLGAKEYCESIGAQLPSREDFARLRGYMGATTAASEYEGTGYRPQVLPNLNATNYSFWSSSALPDPFSRLADAFNGFTGYLSPGYRNVGDEYAVRCVARRSP